ncbi:MAG: DUF2127 domain-containing protein [Anaerolineae bacterium]|nr:DUF2127 domain-containing protein [Anaerolineae bacterium]MDQ7033587.1 DUF2127 domain-containing protein [Anaerolineae bacterium]
MSAGKPKRPFGVAVIVLLTLAIVSVTLFPLLALPSLPSWTVLNELEIYAAVTPFRVVNIVLVPFQLLLAFGLWYLRRWAWVLYMIQLGISMTVSLQAHFSGHGDADYVGMAINVLIVFYLNQRDVQQAFGYHPQQREDG